MKLQLFGTVGRATVPADTGRHGGRPYDSTRSKFLSRLNWPLFRPAAALTPKICVIKLSERLLPRRGHYFGARSRKKDRRSEEIFCQYTINK